MKYVSIPSGCCTEYSPSVADVDSLGVSLYGMNLFHPVSPLAFNKGYANGS